MKNFNFNTMHHIPDYLDLSISKPDPGQKCLVWSEYLGDWITARYSDEKHAFFVKEFILKDAYWWLEVPGRPPPNGIRINDRVSAERRPGGRVFTGILKFVGEGGGFHVLDDEGYMCCASSVRAREGDNDHPIE